MGEVGGVAQYFRDGFHDVVDVAIFSNEEKLREPDGFIVCRAFGDGTADVGVIDIAKLGADFGRSAEEGTAVDGFVETSVAGDAFGFERGAKQIAADARVAVLEDVAVICFAGDAGLRGKRSHAVDGREGVA